MFNPATRYITRGIDTNLPKELLLLLWHSIDEMQGKIDYLQVFTFEACGSDLLAIHHKQEKPKKEKVLYVPMTKEYNPILTQTIFVIDDGDHSTMLFSYEY